MKKLAIMHSGDLNNVSIGGVSQYIQEIIKNEENYAVTVFGTCEVDDYQLGKEYSKVLDGKHFVFIPITNNKKHPLSIYYFLRMFSYIRKLREYDVIYCQRMEYVLPFLFSDLKSRVVMAVHGSGAYTKIWRGAAVAIVYSLLERIAMNIANKVIVLQMREEFGVPYYKKRYRKNAHKVFFGKVPIDEETFYKCNDVKKNIEKEFFHLLYVGRVDNNPKRVLLFPEIIDGLITKNIPVKMTVVGDGPSMDQLQSMIDEKCLDRYFEIKGKIDHGKELTKIINEADAAFIISSFEGICMSALECIACGVPVIATDVGDIKEYIKNDENGIIIPNSTNEEIVDNCIKSVLHIIEYGCKMNELYLNYSASKMIEELEEIFVSNE